MTDNVVNFRSKDGHACQGASDIFEMARDADLEKGFAIGVTKEGRIWVDVSCNYRPEDLLLALERFKHQLLTQINEEDDHG